MGRGRQRKECMSAFGRKLWRLLDKQDDWKTDEFLTTHTKTEVSFWIANGAFFFDVDDDESILAPGVIGLLERHWLFWKWRIMIGRKHDDQAKRLLHQRVCKSLS